MTEKREHWEKVFKTKDTSKVSWFQSTPDISIELIIEFSPARDARIFEVGGGDSKLPDFLMKNSYKNISVLDISETALAVSQKRLEKNQVSINWICSDILDYKSSEEYDLWHDRAVFHFILSRKEQQKYKQVIIKNLADNGRVILGTFSKNKGPLKCSNLNVCQHDEESIRLLFEPEFQVLKSFEAYHTTPSGGIQNFSWNILQKKKTS